jgi:hypothetical protein
MQKTEFQIAPCTASLGTDKPPNQAAREQRMPIPDWNDRTMHCSGRFAASSPMPPHFLFEQ